METGIASLAGLPRKLPRCQDGAILWFAGGEGDYIMQLLGGEETTLTEADGDGAPSACLEKCCILLLSLSFSFFFCFFVLTLLEAAEQKKTLHPYLDLKYVLNRCSRRKKKRTAPLSE